jgi:hypothetical protein
MRMIWTPCENGSTSGTLGSEGGVVLRDEEHETGARITLEECGHPPFAITCGIYGVMVHTAFAATEIEANDAYDAMKADIEMLLGLWPDDDAEPEAKSRFCDAISAFANKY